MTALLESTDRSYAIIGAGALGGFCGARLQQAGREVHFLVNRDYKYIAKHGIRIESANGDFKLPHIQVYDDSCSHTMPACDVVVITLKTTQNDLLRSLLPGLLKPDGVVLVLQNGLGMEAEIASIVGNDRVLGGVCFICTTRFGPGYIRHFYYDLITLAEYQVGYAAAGISQRMRHIATDLEGAGFLVHGAEDLLLARWQKLICDLPFSGLSVVLNATIHQIMANAYAQQMVEQIMQEVIAIAATQGCKIAEDYVQKRLASVAQISTYRTCMKVDYDEKRSMELEAIVGNPLRIAQQARVNTPQIAMLYQQLKYLDVCNQTRGTRFALAS